jgi:hypothetical protein
MRGKKPQMIRRLPDTGAAFKQGYGVPKGITLGSAKENHVLLPGLGVEFYHLGSDWRIL